MLRRLGVLIGVVLLALGVGFGLAGSFDRWPYLVGLVGIVVGSIAYERGRRSGGGGPLLPTGREAGPYGGDYGGGGDFGGGDGGGSG